MSVVSRRRCICSEDQKKSSEHSRDHEHSQERNEFESDFAGS